MTVSESMQERHHIQRVVAAIKIQRFYRHTYLVKRENGSLLKRLHELAMVRNESILVRKHREAQEAETQAETKVQRRRAHSLEPPAVSGRAVPSVPRTPRQVAPAASSSKMRDSLEDILAKPSVSPTEGVVAFDDATAHDGGGAAGGESKSFIRGKFVGAGVANSAGTPSPAAGASASKHIPGNVGRSRLGLVDNELEVEDFDAELRLINDHFAKEAPKTPRLLQPRNKDSPTGRPRALSSPEVINSRSHAASTHGV